MKTGVLYSIAASTLFALMPAYLQLLPAMHSFAVIGQRVIWSSIIITVVLFVMGQLKPAMLPLKTIRNWPGLLCGALLIGSMWGIFIWGPLNGDTLGVAMGFFLAPLVLVVIGLLGFKDRLTHLQYLACAIATLAVLLSLWKTGYFSWTALIIATGYPLYIVLRRLQPIPILTAFYIENILLLPVAIWACISFGEVSHPFHYEPGVLLLFFGMAMLGTMGILLFLEGSKRLPMAIFGLLGYLEPLFIFLVALAVIGEKIRPGEGLTYLLIGLAIALLAVDGTIQYFRQRKTGFQI